MINSEVILKLDSYRCARDEATRLGERLHDEASLHRIVADRLDSESALVFRQVNEDVPVPVDLPDAGK